MTRMQPDTLQPDLWRLLRRWAWAPVQGACAGRLCSSCSRLCGSAPQQTCTPCADTEVIWSTCVQADVFQPDAWRSQLQGGVGVVSCLGAFGSNDFMLKVGAEQAGPQVHHVAFALQNMTSMCVAPLHSTAAVCCAGLAHLQTWLIRCSALLGPSATLAQSA